MGKIDPLWKNIAMLLFILGRQIEMSKAKRTKRNWINYTKGWMDG